MTTTDHIVGVHLSHVHARSALVVVRRVERLTDEFDDRRERWRTSTAYQIPYLERPPSGTRYGEVVEKVRGLIPKLSGNVVLVVDVSVSGLPPIGLFRGARLKPVPVHIATSPTARAQKGAVFLPRRDLVSAMAIILGDQRLAVARMEGAEQLQDALDRFREEKGDHDDLVLAAALACWWGEHRFGSRAHQPPPPRRPVEVRAPTFKEAMAQNRR